MSLGVLPALARGTLPMTIVGGDVFPLALALPGFRLFERGLVGVEARGMGRPCEESCVRTRGALILAPLLNYASTPNLPEAYRKLRSRSAQRRVYPSRESRIGLELRAARLRG